MTKYTLRVDLRDEVNKRFILVLEYDSDDLDRLYSMMWQNREIWFKKDNNYIINLYDIDADDGLLYHFPEV